MADNQLVTEGDLERVFSEQARENADENDVAPVDPAAQAPDATVAPEVTETPGEPAPEVDPVLAAAAEAGIPVEDFSNPQDLFAAIAQQRKQLEEVAPYVDYAKKVLPYDDAVQKAIAPQPDVQQVEPPTPEEEWDPAKHFAEQWKAPEYKKEWEPFLTSGMITIDDKSGQYIPSEGFANSVPLPILQGLNEHRNFQRGALERLVENPYQSTWEAFQEPLEKLISAEVEKRVATATAPDDIGDWEKENESILYAEGTDIYGNRNMSDYGEKLLKACQEVQTAAGDGLDQMAAIRIAERMVPRPTEQTQQQETTPAPADPDPAGKKQSFLDDAIAKAGHSPNSGGYAENTETEPVIQTGRELDNLFLTEARKAGLK